MDFDSQEFLHMAKVNNIQGFLIKVEQDTYAINTEEAGYCIL